MKTDTQKLQERMERIAPGQYHLVYVPLRGFYADSCGDQPPHALYLGLTAAHAESRLDDLERLHTDSGVAIARL